jgi:tol-pal system protein YbgF
LRTRWVVLVAAALLAGAVGGALVAPAPVGAVAKEIIELQRDVQLLLQAQRDLQRSVDEKHAIQKTLLEQQLDAVSKLNTSLGSLQKTMQDIQANSGARLDSMSTQVQGLADNLEEVKARLGKINQQLAELQGTVQSLDAKISGGTPAPANPPAAPSGPPPSADVLYSSGLRDITGGKYDLARQEFTDYLKYYGDTDLASNAQFYLGEISYAQKQYQEAVGEYDKVLQNYPKSFKLAPARLKKGMALLELGQKPAAIREFREIVRRYPGTEEERRARAKLKDLGATPAPSPTR